MANTRRGPELADGAALDGPTPGVGAVPVVPVGAGSGEASARSISAALRIPPGCR
ncbi:hypothetical protein GCM10027614_18830 [Micromonospora vulcania]